MYKIKISFSQGHTKVLGSHPQTVRTYIKNYGNKKDVGVSSFPYLSQRSGLRIASEEG